MLLKKYGRSEIATELIYKAISELRDELALLDSTIEQVEALAQDPPKKIRPRKPDPNRPIEPRPSSRSGGREHEDSAFRA